MVIIGIAGAAASGKTLFASTIVEELGSEQVTVISADNYYKDLSHLSIQDREKINYDHPNSIDIDLMVEHIASLRNLQTIESPIYDYTKHVRSNETRTIKPSNIIILEGILIFTDKALRDMMDIRIYVDTPLDLCLARRIKRDVIERDRSVKYIIKQYMQTVRPMFLKFIEPSKKYAHLIVPKGGKNRVAIEIIKTHMKELLRGNTIDTNVAINANLDNINLDSLTGGEE